MWITYILVSLKVYCAKKFCIYNFMKVIYDLINFLLGTFGRIFHGILVDEKDPNKEKQAFVKTVKGKIFPPILFS